MSNVTKEWLQKTIAELEEERDAVPGVVNEDAAMALAAMKLALASLEAEPVYQVLVDGSWTDYDKQHLEELLEAKPSTLFRVAYPSPPIMNPVSVDADDNFYSWFGREWHEHYQHNQYTTAAKQMLGVMAESAWKAGRRAAMLQGADRPQNEPQNIPENIPATQFKPVAELYGLTSPTGGETSFTFDAVEARDFIDGGWSCQEYVELERFQEAITNHTEDKLAMVDHSGDSNNMVEPVTTACKLRDAVDTIRNSGIAIDGEKIFAERDALNAPDCWCRTCRPITLTDMRFVVCPECGNKRCPHANDHRNACTGSNEPGQEGSAYPAAPQQEE
ncbi:hypothetical protein QN246_04705 [Enterobacter hormaechei]|uniref:hypothetical protein n=1 Tax=Enterobacter hormaechei TaxID=158836 RepID=UPI0024C36D1A|nr:hypothetical protein [Enterobacter hormaechei]MDK1415680.1 hypothetical protein [Enterobacter hormaechei]